MMRTKELLKMLAASVMAVNILAACAKDDQTPKTSPGELGKISIDRVDIGAYQPFTLECPVTLGKNVASETVYWENAEGITSLHPDKTEMKDGKSYYYVSGLTAGEHTLTCKLSARGMDGKDYSSSQVIQVHVKATDIRNNYWGESKEETRHNLQYYSSLKEMKDGSFYILERDAYGKGQNFSSEITESSAIGSQSLGNRIVFYHFSTTGKLDMIHYDYAPTEYEKDMIAGLANRQRYQENYYGFKNPVYDYQVAKDQILTEEELGLAEAFKAGDLSRDLNSVLSQAIADEKLTFSVEMVDENSFLRITTELTVGGKVHFWQAFTPVK